MEKYRISVKRSAVKEIEEIPQKKDRQRIMQRIGQLADDPHPSGSSKLSGHNKYRIRQGNYRVIYEINGNELTVVIVKVGQRKDVYRDASS